MLVTVKGPNINIEELVRQDKPVPGGPCASTSDDSLKIFQIVSPA